MTSNDIYIENLNNYFKLKQSYEEKINNEKQIIINNNNLTMKEKQLKFQQYKKKCINCKQFGGTYFTITDNTFKAFCGNTTNPCDLNIIIKRQTKKLLSELLQEYIINLEKLKSDIIITKLNFIFSYDSEEQSVGKFNELKKKLNSTAEKYNELYIQYLNIINNQENSDIIKTRLIDKGEIIKEIKSRIQLFKQTNNITYIKECIELYITDLVTINDELKNLKYSVYEVEKIKENNYLLKEKYSIEELEINI